MNTKPCSNCGQALQRTIIAHSGDPNDLKPIYAYGSPGHMCPPLIDKANKQEQQARLIQDPKQRSQAIACARLQNVWSGVK